MRVLARHCAVSRSSSRSRSRWLGAKTETLPACLVYAGAANAVHYSHVRVVGDVFNRQPLLTQAVLSILDMDVRLIL